MLHQKPKFLEHGSHKEVYSVTEARHMQHAAIRQQVPFFMVSALGWQTWCGVPGSILGPLPMPHPMCTSPHCNACVISVLAVWTALVTWVTSKMVGCCVSIRTGRRGHPCLHQAKACIEPFVYFLFFIFPQCIDKQLSPSRKTSSVSVWFFSHFHYTLL